MAEKERPPIDDPSLCSFECEAYRQQSQRWRLMEDVWDGDLAHCAHVAEYLPQEPSEPGAEYKVRLSRTPTENHLMPTIEGFSGAVGKFSLVEGTEIHEPTLDNINLKGDSLKVFLDTADTEAMLNRYCWVMVAKLETGLDPQNRGEEQAMGIRPYLSILKASQVINWNIDTHQGRKTVTQATIKERHPVKNEKSIYGFKAEILYRVIRPGAWWLIRLVRNEATGGKWREVIEDQGEYLYPDGSAAMPLFPYSLTSKDWANGKERPPFWTVARLNILLTQQRSDHEACKRMKNHPVPIFKVDERNKKGVLNDRGEVDLGNHNALFVGTDGGFSFEEPSGSSLTINREDIEETREQIRARSMEFLTGEGSQKTATEIRLNVLQIQAALARMAKRKESGGSDILQAYSKYLGKELGRIEVAADISVLLFNIEDISTAYNNNLLSLESAVQRMSQVGYYSDPESELIKLKAQQAQAAKAMADSLRKAPGDLDDDQ